MSENNVVHLPIPKRNLITLHEEPRVDRDPIDTLRWSGVWAAVVALWGFVLWASGIGSWLIEFSAIVLTVVSPVAVIFAILCGAFLLYTSKNRAKRAGGNVPPTPLRIVVDNDTDDLPPAA